MKTFDEHPNIILRVNGCLGECRSLLVVILNSKNKKMKIASYTRGKYNKISKNVRVNVDHIECGNQLVREAEIIFLVQA